ncbi:MAG: arginase family protein [Lewinellaceae bacterium]|nr:arginase family protein [Lewinellaceae bacterium]
MNKAEKAGKFNPDAPRQRNGHFMGLPFTEAEAEVVLLSAPWGSGIHLDSNASTAAANILEASYLLSPYDPDAPQAGLCLRLPEEPMAERCRQLLEKTASVTLFAENGKASPKDGYVQTSFEEIDKEIAVLQKWLKQEANALLDQKKRVGLIGGDSSAQLGLLQALAERYTEFGILHLGARMGLNASWPGPACSPETLFAHALHFDSLKQLSLAGIRCAFPQEEKTAHSREHISVFHDHDIRRRLYRGHAFSQICGDIIRGLPDRVYLSFDIDALKPQYGPNASHTMPGGFEIEEALYLVKRLLDAELEIIGFGLCGVAGLGHARDGQAGALLAYRLGNLMGVSGLVE